MKKTFSNTAKIVALAMAISLALAFTACNGTDKNTLAIAKQGVFTSGGSVTEPVAGNYAPEKSWLDPTRAGNTAHVDHANTFYQIPAGKTKNPIVYLHGYGQSRTGWQTTPDGREGWSDIFLRKGYPAFLVDQPRRASAGSTSRMASAGGIDAWGEDRQKGNLHHALAGRTGWLADRYR